MPRTWQPEPRERLQQRPQNETASVSPDWNGPHLARLDAWFERRERILAEIPQGAEQSQTPPSASRSSRFGVNIHPL
jgi:hypothetical protein